MPTFRRPGFPAAIALLALLGAGCATPPAAVPAMVADTVPYCAGQDLVVDARFDGGNIHSCKVAGYRRVEILVRPEDAPPINPSSWYAFRISANGDEPVEAVIRFEGGPARYWPKLSSDRNYWRPARDAEAQFSEDGSSLHLVVRPNAPMLWVAGQPLVLGEYYADWLDSLDALDFVSTRVFGHSVEGRPLLAAMTEPRPETVYLFGRQHPPEVSGALAMRSFVDAVLGDTALARQFRRRYQLVIVPLVNPDGVAHGHWRHNMNGVDLNRDWGPFTQPETNSLRQLVGSIESGGARPALMLDFHSTGESLFYTQLPEESSWPIDFATTWFERTRSRIPGFAFRHEPRAKSEQANTKNYFFDRYRIPALTYEIGDEVAPDEIVATTPVFAEEMMRLLLEYSAAEQVSNRDNPIANEGRGPALPLSSPR